MFDAGQWATNTPLSFMSASSSSVEYTQCAMTVLPEEPNSPKRSYAAP